jgi:hypothetical protein
MIKPKLISDKQGRITRIGFRSAQTSCAETTWKYHQRKAKPYFLRYYAYRYKA